ncbi:MAG TPA: glycoside hydrolase family 30 beta sandwich domain-containing protein [Candidatus Saccharimonadales bacterium]|nr:glycoside hydrolase family 30 beta sandwich domain-containing protein [Candidatus Saccharimonadales bacterium]
MHFRWVRSITAAALMAASTVVPAQTIHVTTTTADLSQALQAQPDLRFAAGAAPKQAGSSALKIEVNPARRFQEIDGFGASLTDSAAWLMETKLDATTRAQAMRALFDAKDGIGLSILRQPMGGTDLARDHYSYDDMPRGQKDYTLARFSIVRDEAVILPALREALAVNPGLKVIGSPWSTPGWMKSSDSLITGSLNADSYAAFAQYFVKYVEGYKAAGVPVWAVTLQNEPLFEPEDYMGLRMEAEQQKVVLRDFVGPAFEKAGLTTKVMVYDHNWSHPEYPATILSDPATARYAAGTAYHCYEGAVTAQSATHEQFPGKDIWETECSGGTWQGNKAFEQTAKLIIGTTRNWSRSVVLWGLALDPNGNPHAGGCGTCRGIITVDGSKFVPTLDYYALGQVSKFVAPGAHRIDSSDLEAKGLPNVAFQNTDGSVVLLVLNDGGAAVSFEITSEGKSVSYTLGSNTLATLHWKTK